METSVAVFYLKSGVAAVKIVLFLWALFSKLPLELRHYSFKERILLTLPFVGKHKALASADYLASKSYLLKWKAFNIAFVIWFVLNLIQLMLTLPNV